MTDLLRFPVFAISQSGVDVYPAEADLVTCHRLAVRSTYTDLQIIDMDRDMEEVLSYRVFTLPSRYESDSFEGKGSDSEPKQNRIRRDYVRVELELSEPTRMAFGVIRKFLLERIRADTSSDPALGGRLAAAKGIRQLWNAFMQADGMPQ